MKILTETIILVIKKINYTQIKLFEINWKIYFKIISCILYDAINFMCSIYTADWSKLRGRSKQFSALCFKHVKAFIPCEHYKWFPGLELKNLLGFEEQWTCTKTNSEKKTSTQVVVETGKNWEPGSEHTQTCYCRIFNCLIHKKKCYFAKCTMSVVLWSYQLLPCVCWEWQWFCQRPCHLSLVVVEPLEGISWWQCI